jgi:hypothetical protein
MTNPYISVVIVGRNDNYGVNFLDRINTFVRSLDHQVRNYPDLMELIVVEWNPLSDRAPLQDVLATTENLPVRIITVPAEVHATVGHRSPVLEFYGKNVGIRRARGQFVLATNPDIVFSNELIETLAQRNLNTNCVYRTDRHDFVSDGIDQAPVEKYVDFALEKAFQSHIMYEDSAGIVSSMLVTFGQPVHDMTQLPGSNFTNQHVPHTNACGDFLLASKEVFFAVRGLFESTTVLAHMDSYSLCRLMQNGITQRMLTIPNTIFHQHHERNGLAEAWNPERVMAGSRSLGPINWGLLNIQLEEWNDQKWNN